MYHKLLSRQLDKYLAHIPEDLPGLEQFLTHVNNSYVAFERDKELSDHAFSVSEQEFQDVNFNLKEQHGIREQAISRLREIVRQFGFSEEIHPDTDKDDIIIISDFIKEQVARNKKTEKSLLHTVNLMQTLLANLQSGILVEDENRKILFTNKTFCKLLQLPGTPDQMIGSDCSETADKCKDLFAEPEAFVEGVHTLLKDKKAVYHQRLDLVGGTILERDYVPIIMDGKYRGHLWQYIDVTTREQNLQALSQREEMNRLIMESALDAILILDGNGEIISWNPSAERIFGFGRDEVIGKSLSEVIVPESLRSSHVAGMKRFRESKQSRILNQLLELPALNKKGEEFPIEIYIITFEQEGRDYYCGFIKDISDRKTNEIKLRKQEEKYRNIIANINLGLLEVNPDETIAYANQSFTDISGYTAQELVGQKTSLFLDADAKELIERKSKSREKGNVDSYELQVRHKNGDLRWWYIAGSPNYNDQNEYIGTIGVHLDITNQKHLEQDLKIAKEAAEDASRAKEIFLANMSHEIRTPLNAIIGMIRELGRENLTPQQQLYLSHSETAARHLLNILNNVLDISKIEAGEFALDIKEFSLSSLISHVKSILQSKVQEKGLRFNVLISPDLSPCHLGDSTRIRQILINLIGNSIKFTDEGKISLIVDVLEESAHSQKIKFIISDTGVGMSREFLGRLFSKFSQEDANKNRKHEGTGLGMAITQEMVQLMHGTIHVDSVKNEGTSVEIVMDLPVGDPSRLYSGLSSETQQDLHGVHVLLVEDNDMNRYIAGQSLKHFGCVVTEAFNGKDAIDKLNRGSFDVILMDIQMPVMDGVEATLYIREHISNNIPIVALTANAFKKDIDQYMASGMNDYVTKPFEEVVLYNALISNVSVRHADPNTRPADPPMYDLARLVEISRGDQSFIHQMVRIFVDQTPAALSDMKTALEQGDYLLVASLAHKLKPGIDNLGILAISPLIRDIENTARDNNPDVALLADMIYRFDALTNHVILSFRKDFDLT